MNIFHEIYQSPEGGTVDLQKEELPTDGYFVGGVGAPLVFETVDRLAPIPLDSFARGLKSRYLGWWTDSETGQLWIDGSDWYQSLSATLVTARDRGELAVYDVANQSEIRCSR
jgi:hypothetical protein